MASGPLDFALSEATDDVAETIAWLTEEGFEVVNESGPPYSSFGFLVDLEGRDLSLRLVLDRSQWCIELGYLGEKREDLRVLMTAMDGTEAETPAKRDVGDPLPVQLPDGVSWAAWLPPLTDWLATADRRGDIERAAASWRQAMIRYWRQ